MKPFVCLIASGLVICALGGCSPRPGASGDVADAGESPAASLTAEEAAAIDRNLLTIQAIALDQEEEIGLLQAQLADAKRTGVPIVDADGGNVIRLPVRVRAVAVSDGGDAA